MRKILYWDFHNTLAAHPTGWAGEILRSLDKLVPNHGIVREDLRPKIRQGFPWQHPEVAHPELKDPECWWKALYDTLMKVFYELGFDRELALELSKATRQHFIEPGQHEVFPHTIDVLTELRRDGWEMYVLSNHVPELETMLDALGLRTFFQEVFNSAVEGYEKPNPEFFRIAQKRVGQAELSVMIGDNPLADIKGAQAVGMPAILLHGKGRCPEHPYQANDIREVPQVLEQVVRDFNHLTN